MAPEEIIADIENAITSWTGRDWEHDLEGEALAEYDAECRANAARAADLGRSAIEDLRAGRIAGAADKVAEAAKIERGYGDDPTWGGVASRIVALGERLAGVLLDDGEHVVISAYTADETDRQDEDLSDLVTRYGERPSLDDVHAWAEERAEAWVERCLGSSDLLEEQGSLWWRARCEVVIESVGGDRDVIEEAAERQEHAAAADCDRDGGDHDDGDNWIVLDQRGHGGGVIVTERCRGCGQERVTNTWATSPLDGSQGHIVVTCTPAHLDDDREAWLAARTDKDVARLAEPLREYVSEVGDDLDCAAVLAESEDWSDAARYVTEDLVTEAAAERLSEIAEERAHDEAEDLRSYLRRAGEEGWRVGEIGLPGSRNHKTAVLAPGEEPERYAELSPIDAAEVTHQDGHAVYDDEVREILRNVE